jgi:hypothetical protein
VADGHPFFNYFTALRAYGEYSRNGASFYILFFDLRSETQFLYRDKKFFISPADCVSFYQRCPTRRGRFSPAMDIYALCNGKKMFYFLRKIVELELFT